MNQQFSNPIQDAILQMIDTKGMRGHHLFVCVETHNDKAEGDLII